MFGNHLCLLSVLLLCFVDFIHTAVTGRVTLDLLSKNNGGEGTTSAPNSKDHFENICCNLPIVLFLSNCLYKRMSS